MPRKLHKKMEPQAKKQGVKGKAANSLMYKTLAKIDAKRKAK